MVISLLQPPTTCFPLNLSALLEVADAGPANVCLFPYTETGSEYITCTLTTAECGVLQENVRYIVTVIAENQFGFNSSSDGVTVCE